MAHKRDAYYKKLAAIVHKAIVKWDPFLLISDWGTDDEYDSLEKRFLSGIINSQPDDVIIINVKKSLEYYGVDIKQLDRKAVVELDIEIRKLLSKIRAKASHLQ